MTDIKLNNQTLATASGSTVTIDSGVAFPQIGYAQLTLSNSISGSSSGVDITWDTITGDTTNITKSGHDITLVRAGVYWISFTANFLGPHTAPERQGYIQIAQTSDGTALASARDSVGNFDSSSNYGSATCTLVKSVSANFQIYFSFLSLSGGTAELYIDSHASIVLVQPA